MMNSWKEAEHMLRTGATDAIVRQEMKESPDGFEHIQIIVNGRDSNTARIMQRYLEGEVSRWASLRQDNLSFFPGKSRLSSPAGPVLKPASGTTANRKAAIFSFPA